MGSLFGGGSGIKDASPVKYTCAQIQTSAQGLPIPIIWGTNRITGNCIDIFNFQDNGNKGSKGGGKGGKGSNDYSASVQIALCEGRADGHAMGLGRCWQGGSEVSIDSLGGFVSPGTATQSVWSEAANVGHNVAYANTCYYANADLDLGASATIPQNSFEMFSTFNNNNVPNIPDANFGDIIPDFLTNARYTLGFDPDLLVNFNEGGLTGSQTSLLVYHYCAGIFVSPILKDSEQTSSILQRWATLGNFWVFWSGTALKCVCLGDTPLTATGPHGEDVVYTPNTTPVYDLGPDDFITADKNDNKNDPPITVTRKDPADGFNQVQLNASIRYGDNTGAGAQTPAYQDTPFRWQDDASIYHVGVQAPNVISSAEICQAGVAGTVVSLIGQRAQYIRNDYAFKLPYTFVLLEPGDIVTLTDPNIGITKFPVRIKQIDEDDKSILSVTAEEYVYGIGTASLQEFEANGTTQPYDPYAIPGPVNQPAFVQPSTTLTGGVSELWIALSGGPQCGGCGVYISFDNVTYSELGTCTTPSIQGTLTAVLPDVSGLDLTSTLSVDCTESSGVVPPTATEQDAQAYRTLVQIDDELLAYGSVTPTGDFTANLTYLERGLYGTTAAVHNPGAPFSCINTTAVFKYVLPTNYVGQELYFLFPTANLFGNEQETLADAMVYAFTPGNVPTVTNVTATKVLSGMTLTGIRLTWVNPVGVAPTSYNFRWSEYPSGTMGQVYGTTSDATANQTSYFIPAATLSGSGDGYLYVSMQNATGTALSAWTADVQPA